MVPKVKLTLVDGKVMLPKTEGNGEPRKAGPGGSDGRREAARKKYFEKKANKARSDKKQAFDPVSDLPAEAEIVHIAVNLPQRLQIVLRFIHQFDVEAHELASVMRLDQVVPSDRFRLIPSVWSADQPGKVAYVVQDLGRCYRPFLVPEKFARRIDAFMLQEAEVAYVGIHQCWKCYDLPDTVELLRMCSEVPWKSKATIILSSDFDGE